MDIFGSALPIAILVSIVKLTYHARSPVDSMTSSNFSGTLFHVSFQKMREQIVLQMESLLGSISIQTTKPTARCRSPHQILVMGSPRLFSNFGAGRTVFLEKSTLIWRGKLPRGGSKGSPYPALQSSAWRSELVLVRLRPVCKHSVAGVGSCPWLSSSSQKASPPRSIKNW